MTVSLTSNNCAKCLRNCKSKDLTYLVIPDENFAGNFCSKCLKKFQDVNPELVVVEIDGMKHDGKNNPVKTWLSCSKCKLRTKDSNLFMKHDCSKMETSLKFIKSLVGDNND